jgi:signal transduction histidine kinase
MAIRGLKSKIALNVTLFLLLGMLSTDVVTIMTAQHNLIRSEVSRGRFMLDTIRDVLLTNPIWDDNAGGPQRSANLAKAFRRSEALCLFILRRDGREIWFGAQGAIPQRDIMLQARQTIAEGSGRIDFLGSTFGVFWVQKKFVLISEALRKNGEPVASCSLAISLEGVYQTLRQSQQMLIMYILINTGILAFLGIYRVFKMYLHPLARLAQRAEEYKEDDEIVFSVRKEDNELQRLSNSLNSLLHRLSAEKAKLRATVASLEATNTELRKAQVEIVRAEKLASVGRLSAGIAHEIGNPIGIVTGYLELLKRRDIDNDERSEYVDRAQGEIERISTIIRQLLEISRPSQAGIQRVSVHALLHDMARVLQVQPFMSHIHLTMALDAETDTINADPNQVRQVFLNLIINATDAVSSMGPDAEGDLVVTTENSISGQWIQVRFSDNGPGIPEENLTNIFDPFFTTKEPGKGTGLGLSVSFMIVQSFGGTIRVESQPGKGTTMAISLPAVNAGAAAET